MYKLAKGSVVPPDTQFIIAREEEKAFAKKVEKRRFWLGLLLGFILGIIGSLTASYLWWSLEPKESESQTPSDSTQKYSYNKTNIEHPLFHALPFRATA